MPDPVPTRMVYAELPVPLIERLNARAKRNRRSRTGELSVILEQILAQEPEAAPAPAQAA